MAERIRTEELDWEDLRHFAALARLGTLSATARSLGVNHATVARRIAALERRLGRALFDRRADGYALTREGRGVAEQAAAMEKGALALLRHLDTGTGLSGPVRLTTVRTLADDFLIARLGGLQAEHPDLELQVITDTRLFSLSRREADLALRLGAPRDSTLLARRAGRMSFAFYVAPKLKTRLGRGERLRMIGYDDDSDFVPEASWLNRHFAEHPFAFRSNSHTSQAVAARSGLGAALLPRFLADGDRGLVEIDLEQIPPPREIWLLIRPDLGRVPRVRAVADHILNLFRRERALFG